MNIRGPRIPEVSAESARKKIWGSLEGANKAAVDREKLREVLGSEIIRELKLK